MKIILAPDSFKGSLSAVDAAQAMARGVRKVFPEAEIVELPLSDGGEGLVASLVAATGGQTIDKQVTGPLGEPVEAFYGVLGDGDTVVIEMAAASGLPLVPEEKRNPLITTTYGTGELIKEALERKCRRIIIGIGGSATNDGGAGMAEALGVRFADSEGCPLARGGGGLARLEAIDLSLLDARVKETEILVACDVNNPLTGERGASRVYGPQKGATPPMVEQLDQALRHYARMIARDLGVDVEHVPGAGAAGGLGAGLMAFLGGRLVPGINLVLDAVEIERHLPGCSMIITGEGKIDAQSLSGKVPVGLARKVAGSGVPVVAVTGMVSGDPSLFRQEGISACFSIVNGPVTLQEAMQAAPELVERITAEIFFLLATAGQKF